MPVDHDAIFKQLLTEFFVEFLELFYPDALDLLERTSITFLDKESFTDILDPDRREADLVVQARLQSQDAYFIIHLEHQAQPDPALSRRMFRYFTRFHDRYEAAVYPIALCSYRTPHYAVPDTYAIAFPQFAVLTFHFRVVQLNRLNWRDFLNHSNPLAAALMARMRMTRNERRQVKLACLAYLAGLPISIARRRMLAQFVDIYLPLTSLEEQQLEQELASLQPETEEAVMEIVSSWGVRAQQRLILSQLSLKLGWLSNTIEDRVTALGAEQTEALGRALLNFHRPDDLAAWLDDNPPVSPDDTDDWTTTDDAA